MDRSLLEKVAWVGAEQVKLPIRGLVLHFEELGGMCGKNSATPMELEWGAAGGLVAVPYHSPWAWMYPPTVQFVDELVRTLREAHELSPDLPVIAIGAGIAGHAALAYTLRASARVSRCAALCPVSDLQRYYSESPEAPRMFHAATGSYSDIRPFLTDGSPLHQAEKMPDVPYLLVHGERDRVVPKSAHSDRLVTELRRHGRHVDYLQVPSMGHCGPFDYGTYRRIVDFVLDGLTPR